MRIDRWMFCLALCLFCVGLGRDAFDKWVSTTDLPFFVSETSVEVRDRNGQLL